MSKQAIQRVALHNWRKDGEPESVAGDPTSAGKHTYRWEAERVINGLLELGYTITRPQPAARASRTRRR